jgi:hypothetical protein
MDNKSCDKIKGTIKDMPLDIELSSTGTSTGTTTDVPPLARKLCSCITPNHNYPEMVWCDNCGKEI